MLKSLLMFPGAQSLNNNADYYCGEVHEPMGACSQEIPEDIVASLRIPSDELEFTLLLGRPVTTRVRYADG
jgi:hypothetical protein